MRTETLHPGRFDWRPDPIGPDFTGWLRQAWHRLAARAHPAADPAQDRIREAAEVREWAMTLWHREPGFAADLLAAADRHERELS